MMGKLTTSTSQDGNPRACFKEHIIAELLSKSQPLLTYKPTFWLHFHLQGEGVEWQDNKLPIPNYLEHGNRGYFLAWQIDGYFGTQAGIDYLNDIIARVIITLSDCRPKRLLYKPDLSAELAHYYSKIYKLSRFSVTDSLLKKTQAPVRADSLGGKDYAFWAIKLYVEDLIRQFGEGTPIPYSMLEEWAKNQFVDHKKGLSTIKAKCRSVWSWYDTHDWELPKYSRKRKTKTKEELYMTRQERALKNSKLIEKKAFQTIANVATGMFANDYKKKNGTWNISKIASELNMHRDTVTKHMKKLSLNH